MLHSENCTGELIVVGLAFDGLILECDTRCLGAMRSVVRGLRVCCTDVACSHSCLAGVVLRMSCAVVAGRQMSLVGGECYHLRFYGVGTRHLRQHGDAFYQVHVVVGRRCRSSVVDSKPHHPYHVDGECTHIHNLRFVDACECHHLYFGDGEFHHPWLVDAERIHFGQLCSVD